MHTDVKANTGFMTKVFNWMALGLSLTGIISYLTANSSLGVAITSNPAAFIILIIAEFGLVMWLSAAINKISSTTASWLFIVYAILNGLTLSVVFMVYTTTSIASTFFICAGTFAATGFYGWITKRDLTSMGDFMMMGLIGLIIAMVVNLFLQSPALYYAVGAIGVIVFICLTAYDVQKLKDIGGCNPGEKVAILGALILYLDFINLFLFLLRFLGVSNND